MKTLRLTWFHLKRIILKTWGLLTMTFIFPVIIIFSFLFIMGSDSNRMTEQEQAVINYSDFVAEKVEPHLSDTSQSYFKAPSADVYEQLDQIEVSMVYEIPEGFPYAKETIAVYSLNGTNRDPLFESEFLSVLTDEMLNEAYAQANISFEASEVAEPAVESDFVSLNEQMAFVLFMILFFMGYSTGIVSGDLSKMRKEGLLTRSLISNTYSWQILGSVLGAYMIYNVFSSLLIVILASALFNLPLTNGVLLVSLILAMGVFVTGLTMLLFRLFKNETLVQMLGFILIMILVFIPLFAEAIEVISFVQYLSPYYWVFDSIDTGQVLPNVFVILLYGLLLFTAGSFKVERLAKV